MYPNPLILDGLEPHMGSFPPKVHVLCKPPVGRVEILEGLKSITFGKYFPLVDFLCHGFCESS